MPGFITPGKQQFFDQNGQPLALGSVAFYVPGTLTPKDTWKDKDETQLNSNPVALDGGGFAQIYGSGFYRQIIKDVSGNTVWDQEVQCVAATASDLPSAGNSTVQNDLTNHQNKLNKILFAADYGYSSSASAAANLTAIKAAIAATPTGGRLIIEEGSYTQDVSGGLSAAALIDHQMTLEIRGTIAGSGFAVQTNPTYLFKVTADNVLFTGTGTIAGDGTTNDTNSGDETTHPGLIYVTGNFFGCSVNFNKPPKVGIALIGCDHALIADSTWTGGVVGNLLAGTGYFGIIAVGGGYHTFRNLTVIAGTDGGKMVNFIFTSGTGGNSNYCTVRDCTVLACTEKLFYGHGDHHQVINNRIYDGTYTDVIRIWGSNALVSGNTADNVFGFCTILDGNNNIVTGNTATNVKQVAVAIQREDSAYVGGFDGTQVTSNVLKADTSSADRTYGVDAYIEGTNSATSIVIANNTISGFGTTSAESLIRVYGLSGAVPAKLRIFNNDLSNGYNGVLVNGCSGYAVNDNTFDSLTSWPIVTVNSANGSFYRNRGLGSISVFGISGFSESNNDVGRDNQWDSNLLAFNLTLNTGTSTVSATKAFVAANATLRVTPANDPARLSTSANGSIAWGVTGTTVTLTHASGNNATSNETYLVEVIQ